MASKENLTALKTLVISMGFLLVGGTVLLAGIVWKKVSAETSQSAKESGCPGGLIDLKGQGTLVETRIEGQMLHVKTRKNHEETGIALVDVCKGTVISQVTLKNDAWK